MRHLFPLFLLLNCLFTLLPGCEPKDELVQTSGSLEIEQDTVLFDTVFTTLTTVTKRLWVHNRNSGAVKTDISLAGTQGNTYTLLVDGALGPARSNVLIRGNDSLLVLVKAKLGETGAEKPFLLTDQLNLLTNGKQQNVKLVAYGQNAYFHRADSIGMGTIVWPNDKPHVIINSPYKRGSETYDVGVFVPRGATLRIQEGTRIYCHAGATMQVDGRLLINANTMPADTTQARQKQVHFQGDRRERDYSEIPGQWGGIFFTASSQNNVIRYTEIKNASFGASILNTTVIPGAPNPRLLLENVVMRNISGSNPNYVGTGLPPGGIVGVRGDVTAQNCLFTNCGEYAVLGFGGRFSFNYCTFANYTPAFRRTTASLTFTNALEKADGTSQKFPLNVSLTNSIVWGSVEDELAFINNAEYYPNPAADGSAIDVQNCLLRTKEYGGLTNAADKPGLANVGYHNLVNTPPPFRRSPDNAAGNFDYRPQQPATALRFGSSPAPAVDLLNLARSNPPIIGAYEPH